MGYLAGGAITTGSSNIAIGQNALTSVTTVSNQVAIGHEALKASTSGTENCAVGYQALLACTTGEKNTAVGSGALDSVTDGYGNTALGFNAAAGLVTNTARHNVAVGREALSAQDRAEDNVAVGYDAMGNGNSASNSQNTAIGSQAMSSAGLAGYGNTALGYNTGSGITSGLHNCLLGRQAATTLETGDENIIVTSYNARTSAAASTGQIVIGHNIVGKGNLTAYIGGSSGAYNEENNASWTTTSDERIKKNITDNNIGLDVINKIQVRNFEYRTIDEIVDFDNAEAAIVNKDGIQVGAIAQELEKILPNLVKEQTTGVKSINTDNLNWYLINAVQELSAEIKKLKGE